MKKEKELMRTTVTNILEKVPNIKRSIEDIKTTNESFAYLKFNNLTIVSC